MISPSPHWLRVTAGFSLALTVFAGCSKEPEAPAPTPPPVSTPPPVAATPRPTPVHTPKPVATPVPTPTPTPTPIPSGSASPTPYVKHYTPDGIYFLTDDISVRLPAGLLGVPAGTCVQRVKDGDDTMTVTDGKDTFEVRKSQLTKEIEAAIQLQKHTRALEDASERYKSDSEEILRKQQDDYINFLAAHPLAAPTASPTPGAK